MVRTSGSQPKGCGFESRRRRGICEQDTLTPQLGVARRSRIACGKYRSILEGVCEPRSTPSSVKIGPVAEPSLVLLTKGIPRFTHDFTHGG
jgi:hypothetical protein